MKHIGFFGGTFDPIHMGHLAIAQIAQEKFKLDKVVFIPSFLPPHKTITPLATSQDRFKMVKLAIAGNPDFEVSDVEVKRKGKSYTIDTLRHFKNVLPSGTKMYFIIGGDALKILPMWKDIEDVLKLATFIVVKRPGYRGYSAKIKPLAVTKFGIDISSTFLRERLRQRKSIRYLVPEAVFHYIEKHKLYY